MPPIEKPAESELRAQMGSEAYAAWQAATGWIEAHYEMEKLWLPGRGENLYEFKYRRGGKTLCALYPRRGSFGFMVIFGAAEREKLAAQRRAFRAETLALYDAAKVYHDGLWLMLPVSDARFQPDIEALLPLKRKPK